MNAQTLSRRIFIGGAAAAGTAAALRFNASASRPATPTASIGIVKSLDIPYATHAGSDPDLTSLDIYAPPGANEAPVMLFVHGGAWVFGDKASMAGEQPEFFCGKGWVYVSINYRMSPDVQFPVFVEDVADAVAWVIENIGSYGGDGSMVFLAGHSAGGQLVALVGTDERYLNDRGHDLSDLSGVIGLDGAGYWIPDAAAESGIIDPDQFASVFTDDPENWADASPVNHVAAGKGIPPFLLFWITKRPTSKPETSVFSSALEDAGVDTEVVLSPDDTHSSLLEHFGEPGTFVTEKSWAFLQRIIGV